MVAQASGARCVPTPRAGSESPHRRKVQRSGWALVLGVQVELTDQRPSGRETWPHPANRWRALWTYPDGARWCTRVGATRREALRRAAETIAVRLHPSEAL
jgi:hypothetical protein